MAAADIVNNKEAMATDRFTLIRSRVVGGMDASSRSEASA